MATVTDALSALGVTEWVLRGEPTNAKEFGSMFRKITGVDENGSGIESDNSSDFGVTWTEVSNKRAEILAAAPLKELRAERDRRIAETDWYALQDVTMSDDMTAYRQALRDITDSATSLDDVTWPTKP